jgi:hypothetical protein
MRHIGSMLHVENDENVKHKFEVNKWRNGHVQMTLEIPVNYYTRPAIL